MCDYTVIRKTSTGNQKHSRGGSTSVCINAHWWNILSKMHFSHKWWLGLHEECLELLLLLERIWTERHLWFYISYTPPPPLCDSVYIIMASSSSKSVFRQLNISVLSLSRLNKQSNQSKSNLSKKKKWGGGKPKPDWRAAIFQTSITFTGYILHKQFLIWH